MTAPFEILSCSWPRPVEYSDSSWTSEPDWDAPVMPALPELTLTTIGDEQGLTIDWAKFFGGQLRGFHVVFRLRINAKGMLSFWADDGCVIRCNGQIVHADRAAHPPVRSEIDVDVGDNLEIAQWQCYGDWIWGARLHEGRLTHSRAASALQACLPTVRERLRHPTGPALKMFTQGTSPFRALVSLYSMILNGYSPSSILVFGEHQWDEPARDLFARIAPFAEIVPTEQLLDRVGAVGGPQLVDMARRHWFVMKSFTTLLYPPEESCFLDDDVFVLDDVEDALQAFRSCDLVFAPDLDLGQEYVLTWPWIPLGPVYKRRRWVPRKAPRSIPTGGFNAGLYWIRVVVNPRAVADYALQSVPETVYPWHWEQGLIAVLYADRNVRQLPHQRYLFAHLDGLPGGTLGYDYAGNPSDFASIHFGSAYPKPSDAEALQLATQILGLCQTVTPRPPSLAF